MNPTIRYDCLDGMDLLASLPDASCQFVLVDPPYVTTDLDFDHAARGFDWDAWWREIRRVTPEHAVVAMFTGTHFTYRMYEQNRREYRYKIIWEKSLATRYLDAAYRPLEAHEEILIFCRKFKESTYNPQKRQIPDFKRVKTARKSSQSQHYRGQLGGTEWVDDGTRHPTTIWTYENGNGEREWHPSQKPLDLIKDLIRTYSNPGDTVLDTFAGSGTVALGCHLTGRHCISAELDPARHARGLERLTPHFAQPPLLVG